jgi:hypothetical protein
METQGGSEDCSTGTCPTCEKAAKESAQSEEVSMAFLLALLPVITLTFFGQLGVL